MTKFTSIIEVQHACPGLVRVIDGDRGRVSAEATNHGGTLMHIRIIQSEKQKKFFDKWNETKEKLFLTISKSVLFLLQF
jgi:hypothetical protein